MANESRITSQVLEVAASGGTVRTTSQIVEATVSGGTVRATSVVIEVVFPFVTIKALETAITSDALVTAQILAPRLKAAISGTATVTASLNETIEQLNINLGTLTGSATVVALFDKNLEHTSSTLSFTQEAVTFNQRPGNTLNLISIPIVETTLSPGTTTTLALAQTAIFETRFEQSLEHEITFDSIATFKHVLPVEAASNTLSFTSVATVFNQTPSNTLVLTDEAVGVIGGILEQANNTLDLTDSVTVDLVILPLLLDTLFLTHDAVAEHISDHSASSTLNFNQIAFGTVVESKCLVILQAPFDFLQTSIVIPCPLFGDTENIVSEVSLRRSMNGATQTHVKTNSNHRLTYTFRILDRLKAIEVSEFFKYYNSDKIRLTNWKGEVWKVNLLTNPIDFVKTGRFRTDVSLEFEGIKLYG